jgi:lipid-A-disaccharide synthase
MTRIGIVAGETSGDLLGAGLIEAIRQRIPDAEFEGIAGPQMIAAGCRALYPSERLSVMGLAEVLGQLRELLSIRRAVAEHFTADPPDVFIGVDAPDFNLGLERRLKHAGIRTVHYVSPSVWAWRQRRVKKIASCVDLMLTLFPFEAQFYRLHNVPVRFVGHPLADAIPMKTDRAGARNRLSLSPQATIVALLPGSRRSEAARLTERFVRTAADLTAADSGRSFQFVIPAASRSVRAIVESAVQRVGVELPLQIVDGRSRDVMEAADAVLLASGTAALEAMLLKRPMVVAYRVSPITYWILRVFRMMKVPYFSLPNLLAGRALVTELIQDQAQPQRMVEELRHLIDHPETSARLQSVFADIHQSLRRNASDAAADAVLELIGDRKN